MAYELPPLPYPYDALEPHIDDATMRSTLLHDKHHQAYLDKVNSLRMALSGTTGRSRRCLEPRSRSRRRTSRR